MIMPFPGVVISPRIASNNVDAIIVDEINGVAPNFSPK
jgi:hypothetical protein